MALKGWRGEGSSQSQITESSMCGHQLFYISRYQGIYTLPCTSQESVLDPFQYRDQTGMQVFKSTQYQDQQGMEKKKGKKP